MPLVTGLHLDIEPDPFCHMFSFIDRNMMPRWVLVILVNMDPVSICIYLEGSGQKISAILSHISRLDKIKIQSFRSWSQFFPHTLMLL